ncbi:hypothetical protein K3495_g611 [Podosphaera aphanis]|nr:hypothetical protein K3495_g611 [Podosphaera aphanis]
MERDRDREKEEKDRHRERGTGRETDRDKERGRFDQRRGETTRIGAGESYKPYGSRPRSPPRIDNFRQNRDRAPRRDRARSPHNDSWYASSGRDRSPRRRSRSPIRRLRTPPKDNWRARSPRRRSPPRRFSPRRDDNRRPRSPFRRDDRRKSRSPFERDRLSHRIRSPIRRRSPPPGPVRRGSPPGPIRRGSPPGPSRRGSPPGPVRRRSPPPGPIRRGSPPSGPRGFRPRSRSPDRREIPKGPGTRRRSASPLARGTDRSALNSRNNSRRSSPRSYTERINLPQGHLRPRSPPRISPGPTHRERDTVKPIPRERSMSRSTAPKSPLRGPTGLRPPTGPGGHRSSNGPTISSSNQPGASINPRTKTESLNSSAPPAGPRGYVPRGGSSIRGGRASFGSEKANKQDTSSWGAVLPNRVTQATESSRAPADSDQRGNQHSSSFLSSTQNGPPGVIPTGPRAGVSSRPSPKNQHLSSNYSRSTQSGPTSNGARQHPALANTPAIITGGRIDPTASGVAPDIAMRLKRKEEEEEALRAELQAKEEKLKQSLKHWDKLSRESSAMGLRSELSERHVRTLAGEGGGGAF